MAVFEWDQERAGDKEGQHQRHPGHEAGSVFHISRTLIFWTVPPTGAAVCST
jgi:hypothetical protein